MAIQQYQDYAEYWDDFLRKHSKRGTRLCHYLATSLALGPGFYGVYSLNWQLILAVAATSYFLAIFSHKYIEADRPMAGKPGWGLWSDLRMCFLALTFRLRGELDRVNQ